MRLVAPTRIVLACLLSAPSISYAQVPDAIVAHGEVVMLTVHAEGAQIYECKASSVAQLVWQFREPVATLIVDGKTVGRHYVGPTWEMSDGSAITGKNSGRAPGATLKDIPWLKLEVMFGPDDAFLNTLVQLLRRLPVYPMFGRGQTRLQPADVEDVGEAAARLMQRTPAEAMTVECGGPRVYTYEELLRTITRAANVNRMLVPVPFAAWHALAWVAEVLPGAPVTRNRVELMGIDTVASVGVPGFADLGISPRAMEEVLQSILRPA